MNYEEGLTAITELLVWATGSKADRNEATTRLHLIDTILKSCLGWPLDSLEAERYFDGDKSDYELGAPSRFIVVEAKREGIYFDVPINSKLEVCKISTVSKLDKRIGEAIDQAMRYAQRRGIPVGVVTNGHQLIAFIASRQDGLPPEDGNALVYDSIDEMRRRFHQLWNCLSYNARAERRIFTELTLDSEKAAPEPLSARLVGYPGFKNRNDVAVELQILGGLFIEDVSKLEELEEEFVQETYCASGALSQYALVSREILATRYASDLEKEGKMALQPARNRKGVVPQLTSDLLAAGLSKRPILLVGDVGVGKSMFIKHLIHVDAKDALRDAIVLKVDFGKEPAIESDIQPYVAGQFEKQLRLKYGIDIADRLFIRGVYHLDVKRFEKGLYGELRATQPELYAAKETEYLIGLVEQREEHLKRCFEHIVRGQKKKLVVFLDNVDQRMAPFQEQVFLVAQSLAENWPATVFVALRPDTFVQSRKTGSLTAYQPRVFSIDPPRVDLVIRKRMEYALRKLKSTGLMPSLPQGVTLDSVRLEQYMTMVLEAFTSEKELIEFVDNMSNGNLRAALDYVAAFVGSAHVDSAKIFRRIDEFGSFRLRRHEFVRAVLHRDNAHYRPSDSDIPNLFHVASHDCKEHFLPLCTLAYIERAGSRLGTEGFVGIGEVYGFLQKLQFNEKQISRSIQMCLKYNLVHTETGVPEQQAKLRINPAGAYCMKVLVELVEYVDAIIVDTPILIEKYRDLIQDEQSIRDRLERLRHFLDYLTECWDVSLAEAYDWPTKAKRLKQMIGIVEARIEKDRLRGFL